MIESYLEWLESAIDDQLVFSFKQKLQGQKTMSMNILEGLSSSPHDFKFVVLSKMRNMALFTVNLQTSDDELFHEYETIFKSKKTHLQKLNTIIPKNVFKKFTQIVYSGELIGQVTSFLVAVE